MYNPFSLAGKTILITGASSGIGKATAIECSKLGAKVIITGRNRLRLEETFSSMSGNAHLLIEADLQYPSDIDMLIDSLPMLDGVVNNAGMTKTIPMAFISEEILLDVLRINAISPILITQKLLKRRKLAKSASIVFTSSISGNSVGVLGNTIYSTTKAAVNGFVKNAALELAPKNIRVNTVCPGMIDTGILSSGIITEEQLDEERKKYPLKRFGKPEEIAYAIIYLLSDASSFVTGSNLFIDGGFTLL